MVQKNPDFSEVVQATFPAWFTLLHSTIFSTGDRGGRRHTAAQPFLSCVRIVNEAVVLLEMGYTEMKHSYRWRHYVLQDVLILTELVLFHDGEFQSLLGYPASKRNRNTITARRARRILRGTKLSPRTANKLCPIIRRAKRRFVREYDRIHTTGVPHCCQ
jgi:hypothetical protein